MKIKNRVGETKIMNNGMSACVIKYNKWEDIDVEFEDGYIAYNKSYGSFKSGHIKNPNIKIEDKRNLKNERLHESKFNICGTKIEIIKYNNYDDIDVKIYDKFNTVKHNTRYIYFKNGTILSPYDKTVHGIGYIGNPLLKEDEMNIKLIDLLSYKHWSGMIGRCYSKDIDTRCPTYIDKYVCDEWLSFENFKKWFDKNYYEINNENMELDKDIIIKHNKVYSPCTCIFVPHTINTLFIKADSIRGDYPIGVYYNKEKNKFQTKISINNKGKHIGYYNTPEEAFEAYKVKKERYIKEIAEEYKNKIPKELYDAMYRYEVEITD